MFRRNTEALAVTRPIFSIIPHMKFWLFMIQSWLCIYYLCDFHSVICTDVHLGFQQKFQFWSAKKFWFMQLMHNFIQFICDSKWILMCMMFARCIFAHFSISMTFTHMLNGWITMQINSTIIVHGSRTIHK